MRLTGPELLAYCLRAALLAPLKLLATLAFFYVLAGWMVLPPGAIL